MEPAFAGQLAGVLEHVCGHGQMMNGAKCRVGKLKREEVIEARFAVRCAAFGAFHFALLDKVNSKNKRDQRLPLFGEILKALTIPMKCFYTAREKIFAHANYSDQRDQVT